VRGSSSSRWASTFGDVTYEDGVDLSHERFYEKLVESDELPKTSQVTPLCL